MNLNNQLLKLSEELIIQSRITEGEYGEESYNNESNFTEIILEEMTENLLIDTYTILYMEPKKQEEIYAYGFSEEGSILDVYTTFFNKNIEDLQHINRSSIVKLFSKPYKFIQELINGTYDEKWDSDTKEFNFINMIHQNLLPQNTEDQEIQLIEEVRIHLVTNAQAEVPPNFDKNENSIELPEGLRCDRLPVAFSIIDIKKISDMRQVEGGNNQSVVVDLAKYDGGCKIIQRKASKDVDVILTILPGALLHDIYERYGRLILQDNVRAYLGAKGKINRTMRDTIKSEPEAFLIYNNGLTIFTDGFEIKEDKLIKLNGCSIVNGGQTLRTIHEAIDHMISNKDKALKDINDKLHVMAKIVSAQSGIRDEIRAEVSLYSNSQNKVTDVDKTAFEKFTKLIEELAVTTKTIKGTYWFFERLRGEYMSRENRERNKFTNKFPKSQLMTKEQLAKYWNAFEGHPTIANLGGQKSHSQFINKIRNLKSIEETVDITFFKRVVARAIFYRTCEKAAKRLKIPGYKSQIVNFTVAALAREIKKIPAGLNEEAIWDTQALDDDWNELIEYWMEKVQTSFHNSVDPRLNAAMEARKEKCWESIKSDMDRHTLVSTPGINNDLSSPWENYVFEDKLEEIKKLTDKDWAALIEWSTDKDNNVETLARQILGSIHGYQIGSWAKEPSEKQMKHIWGPITRWLVSKPQN